jgi:hypothetical protein
MTQSSCFADKSANNRNTNNNEAAAIGTLCGTCQKVGNYLLFTPLSQKTILIFKKKKLA